MNYLEQGREVVKAHLSERQLELLGGISTDMKGLVMEFGMGAVYARSGLDAKSRKIATLASLISTGNSEQIRWHIAGGLDSGLINPREVRELIIQMVLYVGFPAAFNAMNVANEVIEEQGQ